LHAEVVALKEKVAQGDGKRSKFDISLSHIPPEVEEKLWVRLREDLGTQVLKQTQEQSAQVLGSAQTMIEQNIVRALEGFRQQVTQQLQTVQQNAQGLSEEMAEAVGQHFNSNAEKFQKQVADAGARAQHQSEEHFRSLQQRLGQEHDAYRREMQKAQDTVSAESSRLQTQVTALGSRIVQLDDTACRLESGMETRLSQMASDQISAARMQLETAVDVVLKELGTRNAKELDRQLDDARGKLKIVQKGIETSVSDLVKTEVAASLLSFGQTMEELAQDSVGRWRSALSKDLTSVARILGSGFQKEPASSRRVTGNLPYISFTYSSPSRFNPPELIEPMPPVAWTRTPTSSGRRMMACPTPPWISASRSFFQSPVRSAVNWPAPMLMSSRVSERPPTFKSLWPAPISTLSCMGTPLARRMFQLLCAGPK